MDDRPGTGNNLRVENKVLADPYDWHVHVLTELAPLDRRPVILVHGLSVSSRYMLPLMRRLAPYFPVYAPDLPGFGDSPKPPTILTVPELADALANWMRDAGLREAALIGNSLGCQVILDVALRYPGLVNRLVLVSPTIDPAARSIAHQVWRGLRDLIDEPLSYWLFLLEDYLKAGWRRTLATLRHAIDAPIETYLAEVRVPVLVVRGELDSIVPHAWAAQVTALLPHARLVTIADESHVAHYSAPGQFMRVVMPFLIDDGRWTADEDDGRQTMDDRQ